MEIETTYWTFGWTAIGAIAACVLALGLFIAIWQVIQAKKSTNAQNSMEILHVLRDDETINTLRSVYKLKREELEDSNDDTLKNNIDKVIDKYCALEAQAVKGIVDKKIAIELGPPGLRLWYKLHGYIERVRIKRGYYADYFEAYVRLCLDHYDKANIRILFGREGCVDEDINLVHELQKEEFRPRSLKEIVRDRKKSRIKREV